MKMGIATFPEGSAEILFEEEADPWVIIVPGIESEGEAMSVGTVTDVGEPAYASADFKISRFGDVGKHHGRERGNEEDEA